MGGLIGWWRRLSGAGRAGVISAAALAVTGAAAVLLAVWSRQPWPPALASVLILAPGLYLAWRALPGAARLPRGRHAAAWDPGDLDVHQVMGGGPQPPYIRRPHDEVLDALLDPAVSGSRLVVVKGGSSTGKTRSAYEAVTRGRLAGWRLEYPLNADALQELLVAGVPARTVLWLGELRQYTGGDDGGAGALGRLARLLETQDRVIAVTTMWPEHWSGYTSAVPAEDEAGRNAGTAGRLLSRLPDLTGRDPSQIDAARGGVIEVPAAFTTPEVSAAARASQVLADAAEAARRAGQDGQIAQYLAGVPDLLDRFQGSGGNRFGQAIIAAAMDAARLGFEAPLPEALLLEAALGYLTGPERVREIGSWAVSAMGWATATLRGAVQAVQPVPPPRGTGVVGYRPADYLDQYGRRTRQHEVGSPELWDALAAHAAGIADLTRLAGQARRRGLYRFAAVFLTSAAAQGSAYAALGLVELLSQANPGCVSRAARWAAAHVSLDNPRDVARLLGILRWAGADDAAAVLLARDPASHASLDNPRGVAFLLEALLGAGARDAAAALLARDPASHASLDNPMGVADLLRVLRKAGAGDAAAALASRDNPGGVAFLLKALRDEPEVGDATAALLARDPAAHASLDNPLGVGLLVYTLGKAGAGDAAAALASRAATDASLDNPQDVANLLWATALLGAAVNGDAANASVVNPRLLVDLLRALREAGTDDPAAALLARDPAAHVSLDNPGRVAHLLRVLREAGVGDAAAVLLARDPAAHASLDNPQDVARLLRVLRKAGISDAAAALANRAATDAGLDNPQDVADLLNALREPGTDDPAAVLLARDPAVHVSLDNPMGVAGLLRVLREAGADDSADVLTARAESTGIPRTFPDRTAGTFWSGREPDGSSQPWGWQEPQPTRPGA